MKIYEKRFLIRIAISFLLTIVVLYIFQIIRNSICTFTVPLRNEKGAYNTTKHILLATSLGRTGSRWVGELLGQQEDSFFVYEPDYYFAKFRHQKLNSEIGVNYIRSQFFCDFSEDFVSFAKKEWANPSQVFRSSITRSFGMRKPCLTQTNVVNNCKNSQVRIIKTIRFPMQYVKQLLEDASLNNLKIVYLVRDPRAVLISRQRLGWNADPEDKCEVLDHELKWVKILIEEYPQKVYLLRYEDLCKDFLGESSRLWSFLSEQSNAPLPDSWIKFYGDHSRQPFWKWTYDIKRDTTTEWFKWRTQFESSEQLESIERSCVNSLNGFGYTLLGSIDVARDLTHSSLKSKDICSEIPC